MGAERSIGPGRKYEQYAAPGWQYTANPSGDVGPLPGVSTVSETGMLSSVTPRTAAD
jgi:hypothetical protein